METVSISIAGKNLEFNLKIDRESGKWTPDEGSANEPLAEGDFPLIAHAGGRRYELYSDGTFAEVEK